eukprot:5475076-Pyramimonas_sp.AAC.1
MQLGGTSALPTLISWCELLPKVVLGNVWWEFFKAIGGVQSRPQSSVAELLNLLKWASKDVGLASPPINTL